MHYGGAMPTIAYTKITRKGQITLPAAIRKELGLRQGDRVEVTVTRSGKAGAVVRRAESVVERTAGSLHRSGVGPFSDEQMKQSLVAAAARRDLRTRETDPR